MNNSLTKKRDEMAERYCDLNCAYDSHKSAFKSGFDAAVKLMSETDWQDKCYHLSRKVEELEQDIAERTRRELNLRTDWLEAREELAARDAEIVLLRKQLEDFHGAK